MSVIVVSVGTSLLTNNIGRLNGAESVVKAFNRNRLSVDDIHIEIEEKGSLKALTPEIEGFWEFTDGFIETYFNEEKVRENIADRSGGRDHLPAEISSLYLYYYDKEGNMRPEFKNRLKTGSETSFAEKDRIILLTTDTADAVYCAKLLREMINMVSLFNTKGDVKKDVENDDIVVIKNLDVYDPSKWAYDPPGVSGQIPMAQKGIERLITYFEETFTFDAEEGSRVLIRTGGYKELSSLLLLLAIQFRFKSLYLFERSEKFVELFIDNLPQQIDLANIIRNTIYKAI